MGAFSWWHLVILGVVVLVFFGGKGKISDVMGDVAKGIKSFKKGLADDPTETASADVKSLEANAQEAARKAAEKVQG